MTLGGAANSVRIGDMNASNAAQTGTEFLVTVDNNGTLGKQEVSAAFSSAARAAVASLAVTDAQFDALAGKVTGLDCRVNTLFDLASHARKEMRRGIALATAMAHPHFPSEPGKTSYATNVAHYRGQTGISAGLTPSSLPRSTLLPAAVAARSTVLMRARACSTTEAGMASGDPG